MRCHAHRTSVVGRDRHHSRPRQHAGTRVPHTSFGSTPASPVRSTHPADRTGPLVPTAGPERAGGAARRAPLGGPAHRRPPTAMSGTTPVRYRHNARCRHDTHNEIQKPRIAIRHTPVFALSVDDPGVPSAVRSGHAAHAGPMPYAGPARAPLQVETFQPGGYQPYSLYTAWSADTARAASRAPESSKV